jgi:hypothetical protein
VITFNKNAKIDLEFSSSVGKWGYRLFLCTGTLLFSNNFNSWVLRTFVFVCNSFFYIITKPGMD